MWLSALLGTLTLAVTVTSEAFNPFRVNPGPKVNATRGEAWPHPYHTVKHGGFVVLRNSYFQFLVRLVFYFIDFICIFHSIQLYTIHTSVLIPII